MSQRIKFLTLALALLPPLASAGPDPDPTPPLVRHALEVRLDPAAGTLDANDRLTLPPGPGPWTLTLHQGLAPRVTAGEATLESLGRDRHLARYLLRLTGSEPVTLSYGGTIRHDLEEVAESLGRAHQRTPGRIGTDGVFLDGYSGWYPRIDDTLQAFTLDVTLPPGWTSVSQGTGPDGHPAPPSLAARSGGHAAGAGAAPGSARQNWREDQPQDDIYLVAAPFSLYRRPTAWGEAQVYLRQSDPNLADRYLEATATYLDLYSRLLGPYPYAKFALVENFWESGYGMPSFTLLGPQVIRLPFIVETSYPHEVLHNWWGNGVYVDYANGNWSEGLTAYLADHLLAERRDGGDAYRRDALKGYADYVGKGQDFPLRDFRSRHSSASQAIGYGKATLFFHMLRRQLGDETFIAALRRFYADQRFRNAGYAELRQAFEHASGRDLGDFFAAWTGQTGAPRLRLSQVSVQDGAAGPRLTGRLEQTQPGAPYPLEVPIRIELADGTVREDRIPLTDREAAFDLTLTARPVRVSIDPGFDLFRILAEGESPVTLSQVFGADRGLILTPVAGPLARAYRTLATDWAAGHPGWEVRDDRDLDRLPQDRPVWLLGWENRHLAPFAGAGVPFRLDIGARTLELPGQTVPAEAPSPVLTRTLGGQPVAWMAAADPAALPGLGRKLPHYGKYSYLVFSGQAPQIQVKGQWPAGDSELTLSLAPAADPPPSQGAPLRRPPLTDLAR
ncbi:MAG TPA: M1 family aminopeptidase [Chromatiaceae bacterium]|nr:M1 family aminopeptidase [Chromatiaceae bacterium]